MGDAGPAASSAPRIAWIAQLTSLYLDDYDVIGDAGAALLGRSLTRVAQLTFH
jgi:hypothetical protein